MERHSLRGIVPFIVVAGTALRIWQYASNQSFWLDETALARNIFGLPLSDLLSRPLYFDQVSPRGFLLVEKLVAMTLGPSELALRLFPFLCSIAGVLLFWRLAERMLRGWAVPFAVFVYAIGIPLIKYAAELKQYGIDAAVTSGLLLLIIDLRDRKPSTKRLWLAGLAGLTIVWFSQTSVLVLAGLGLALAIEWLITRDDRAWRILRITVAVWAIASLLAVLEGRHSMTPSTRIFMDDFWKAGFLPLPFQLSRALPWLWDRWVQIYADPYLMRYPWPWMFVLLAAVGLFAIWRARRDYALFLFCPLVIALLSAIAHQYPLHSRVTLYLVPILTLASAAGAERLRALASRASPALGAAVMAACLLPPAIAVVRVRPPYVMEDHRVMLAYLQKHRRPGDSLYVVGNAHSPVIYYGPRFGIQRADWRLGACNRDSVRPFLKDLDRYRGVSRLWIISPGVRPLRVARESTRQYLGTIGIRRDSLFLPSSIFGPLSLELYDLSDTARLRAAVADTLRLPPMPTTPRPGCRNWSGDVQAMARGSDSVVASASALPDTRSSRGVAMRIGASAPKLIQSVRSSSVFEPSQLVAQSWDLLGRHAAPGCSWRPRTLREARRRRARRP